MAHDALLLAHCRVIKADVRALLYVEHSDADGVIAVDCPRWRVEKSFNQREHRYMSNASAA